VVEEIEEILYGAFGGKMANQSNERGRSMGKIQGQYQW
jgi:hypothetical protein